MIDKSENEGSDAAARKAMEWCIALQDSPEDAQLRAEFEAWLAEAGEHARAWERVNYISDLIVASETSQSARPTTTKTAQRRNWASAVKVALPIAVAACAMLLILPSVLLNLQADHMTGTGETRKIVLGDQSVVELAPESAIKVTYSAERRHVTLLSGHAFFDVRSAPQRPFSVAFGRFETRVLGTTFEVRLYEESSLVGVSEGVVAVKSSFDTGRAPTQLVEGQVLRVGDDDLGTPVATPPEQIAAWRDGRLIVKNRPIGEVIETLEQYHSGIIVQAGAELGNLRLTGVYDIQEPEQVLRAVALAHNLTVRRITPWILTISRL